MDTRPIDIHLNVTVSLCRSQVEFNLGVCKVFGIVGINSKEKPVTHCRVGSLCPAMPCSEDNGRAQRPAPTMVGEKLMPITLHTPI